MDLAKAKAAFVLVLATTLVISFNQSNIARRVPSVISTGVSSERVATNRDRESTHTEQNVPMVGNIPEASTGKNRTQSRKPAYITVWDSGRLGNQMLHYAGLFCAALANTSRQAFLRTGQFQKLKETFPNLAIPMKNITLENSGRNNPHAESFGPHGWFKGLPRGNLTLYGHFASHVYVTHVEMKIRKEYTFTQEVVGQVNNIFATVVPPEWKTLKFIRVGIHVRRGDRLCKKLLDGGEVVHPPSYFLHAMEYFKKQYDRIQFIVASDDLKWCREHLNSTNVVFTAKSYIVDMAILTMCDHIIISAGSYGWWAGYLCKGTTVYYGVSPRNGTSTASLYANGRWIPPPPSKFNNWVSII